MKAKTKNQTVTVRLNAATLAEIDEACSIYNESKNAMICYLVRRGLHEYRAARTRDKDSTNILQLLELQPASANSGTDC